MRFLGLRIPYNKRTKSLQRYDRVLVGIAQNSFKMYKTLTIMLLELSYPRLNESEEATLVAYLEGKALFSQFSSPSCELCIFIQVNYLLHEALLYSTWPLPQSSLAAMGNCRLHGYIAGKSRSKDLI